MTRRPVIVERRRIAPRSVGRRAWSFPLPDDPEPPRRPRAEGPVPERRPILAEVRELFRRSPERCPKPLYQSEA